MPWSGGSYTKGNNATGGWTGDASLGIGIEAGRHDTQDNDFATGINQCLNKDGSNAATGPLNAGGFKVTNAANATVATDVVTLGQAEAGISTSGTALNITNTQFSNNSSGVVFGIRKSRGATVGTNTIVQNGDEIGSIVWQGANGTGYTNAAAIGVLVSGTPGATNDMPGTMIFSTTPDGSGTSTERMRIDSNGNVGIGAAPTGTLDVRSPYVDADDFVVGFPITGNYYVKSKLVSRHTTGSAANVFIDPSNHLLVRSTSSSRYKTDIRDYTKGLADVMNLAPKFYKGITDGDKQFAGLIAEEVDAAGLSEFVVYNDDNQPDALHYGNMVALAFKAIQDLNAKVEALETRVAALEA